MIFDWFKILIQLPEGGRGGFSGRVDGMKGGHSHRIPISNSFELRTSYQCPHNNPDECFFTEHCAECVIEEKAQDATPSDIEPDRLYQNLIDSIVYKARAYVGSFKGIPIQWDKKRRCIFQKNFECSAPDGSMCWQGQDVPSCEFSVSKKIDAPAASTDKKAVNGIPFLRAFAEGPCDGCVYITILHHQICCGRELDGCKNINSEANSYSAPTYPCHHQPGYLCIMSECVPETCGLAPKKEKTSCENCGKIVNHFKSPPRKSEIWFCSPGCYYENEKKKLETSCLTCGRTIKLKKPKKDHEDWYCNLLCCSASNDYLNTIPASGRNKKIKMNTYTTWDIPDGFVVISDGHLCKCLSSLAVGYLYLCGDRANCPREKK